MKQRWRSLVEPDGADHIHSPNPSEALGVWVLGVLWALSCLWLGYLGEHWVLPGALIAGLLAMWGWRHMEWLWWFPTVLVVATLLEPLSPLPMRTRFGPLVYIDLLTLGVLAVAVARALGLRLPLLPRTPVDALVFAAVGLHGASLLLPAAQGHSIGEFKHFVVRVVVFYATTTVASRPYGSRWVWVAFPLASALIGFHALWAMAQGPGLLEAQMKAADLVWSSNHGAFNALLVALPLTLGLASNAGATGARIVWSVASLLGIVGLAVHARATSVFEGFALRIPATAFESGEMTLGLVIVVAVAVLAWKVRAGRPHEGPRWVALMLAFVLSGVLILVAPALTGPAVPLMAVAAGLVVGTYRADQRAIRSGRQIGPELQKAA